MAYNEKLTKRVRTILADTRRVTEKRMFSGAGFIVDGNLCVSVGDDRVMLRVDPSLDDELVAKKGCRPMIMKGREYEGYVLVQENALRTKRDLERWIVFALDFNKFAKACKRRQAEQSEAGVEVGHCPIGRKELLTALYAVPQNTRAA